jgi:general secretion pathway protein D
MGKMRHFWMDMLIVCLVVGISGCMGTQAELKKNPDETSTQQIRKSKEETAAPLPVSDPQTSIQPSGVTNPTQPTSTPMTSEPPISGPSQPPIPLPSIAQAKPQPSAPTPTPPAPPPGKAPEVSTSPGVVFNFDNADLYEVIRVMAEIMKFHYIIDPRVKGVVNIHTSGQIPVADVFPIFQSILKLNGATAVKRDGVYEIVPLSEAKKLSIPLATQSPEKFVQGERYVIQIIPLKYIPVTEVSKMIKPFLSDGADIVEHPPLNILIIGDLASNVKKSLDIIGLFDIDIFTDLRVRIYPILNADVNEVAKEMERIFSSFEVSTKSGRGVGITFTPITRINSLLVVSSIPNIFEKVEGWLKELDKIPAEGSKASVFVYYVQNTKAKDLAEVLKEIFVKAKEKKAEKPAGPAEAAPRGVRPTPTTPSTTPAPATAEGGAVPEGEINIVVDETTNSLVIKAFQRDYRNILETIKKLDIYPKQVLIEALLAEITLDDSNKFGIEWARFLTSSNPNKAQEVIMGATPPTPPFNQALAADAFIRYSIVELGGRVSAAIKAAASTNRLNVISSPHIIASNNKEARIQIGKSQPVLTNSYTTTATGTPDVVEGTIEYKDIGVILTVTPRISDGGLITLEMQIEKSDVSSSSLGNLSSIPVFDKKTAKTIVSVLQGQMIIIGGFIEDSRTRNKSGVPLLHKIPLLGALFGTQEYINSKTELILLMVPHIITDQIQSKTVTDEFRDRVEGLKRELERMKEQKR